jgi:transcriptional regulator with XRE-family HTH domain
MSLAKVALKVGKNVRLLRIERRLTQAQMAKLAEIPRSTWAFVESGRANPTLDTLYRVATTLGVAVDDLFGAHTRAQHNGIPR